MATYSICAMRSASRSFAIFSSFLLAALRSSFGFDHAQFRSLLFCHLLRHAHSTSREVGTGQTSGVVAGLSDRPCAAFTE